MRCVRFEDLKTGFIGIGFINGDSITRVQGSLETYWQITEDVYSCLLYTSPSPRD